MGQNADGQCAAQQVVGIGRFAFGRIAFLEDANGAAEETPLRAA